MSARALAAKVQPGSTVRWDRLEKAAFAGHDVVISALEGRRTTGGRPVARWKSVVAALLAIIGVAFLLAPIAGFVILGGGRFQDYSTPAGTIIPASGTFYACAGLYLLGWFIAWIATGRRYTAFGLGYAVLTLILGVVTAFALAAAGERESVTGWEAWVLVVVIVLGIAALFAVVQIIARYGARTAEAKASPDAPLPPNRLAQLRARRSAVDALDESDRLAATSDLEAAIADLERRGLISADEADRARSTELGGLALRMGRS